MPRKARRKSGTDVYHIVARGNNKEKILERDVDKITLIRILKKSAEFYSVTIYAYCIMINHVHIMIKAEEHILPKFMQHINSTYAEGYNMKYDRCGHVFQGRYYSDCVETEEYYWCCLRYIHNNPVKISLAAEPYDYAFSSASEYFSGSMEVIGEPSYHMLKTRFQSSEEFWQFHRQFEQKSFLDTVEDEHIHNYERVKKIVEKYMFENKIEEVQTILSIGAIKQNFLEDCKQKTGISARKIENILKTECKGVRPLCTGV